VKLRAALAPLLLAALAWGAAGAEPAGRAVKGAPEPARRANALLREKSPYLLQHAYNPVDWLPWGAAAFEKARREDKPIFLSIGYSTCHWCHVMERESFEDREIARMLNRHFVPVKVDREERPDVDRIYMTAATAAGWGGGWPLNLFLTPDREPFFGGTYFPPDARWGRPGFPQILERVVELWGTRRKDLSEDARKVGRALRELASSEADRAKLEASWLDGAYRDLEGSYDSVHGGFGTAPKFPMPINQNFLLRYWARSGEPRALEMAVGTLKAMAEGGIYDHLGGGFSRYSVDGEWRVPHFEKMLYDNAQLAVNFLEAFQASKDTELARVAGETLRYVLRDLALPEGGFASAEDADSLPPEGAARPGAQEKEGAFYLWTLTELEKLLGPEAAKPFAFRYGVRPEGNAFDDPHGEFRGRNILFAEGSLKETAAKFGRSEGETRRLLDGARAKLLEARSRRPRPGRDDKVLASWNGLMLSALAKGYQVLEDPAFLAAGRRAAGFLRKNLYDPGTRRLFHRWAGGERAVPGMADDYAFLVQGLLDLYEADFDLDWLDWAVDLTETQNRSFLDAGKGVLYMTSEGHDQALLARMAGDTDNVEPSAASVAALNLLRLAQFTGRKDFRDAAQALLERAGEQMRRLPRSLPQMLVAADFALSRPRQIVLAGDPQDPASVEMLRVVRSRFLPAKVVLWVTPGPVRERLAKLLPFLQGVHPIRGKTTAFVCVNYACELPTTDLRVLEDILDGKSPQGR